MHRTKSAPLGWLIVATLASFALNHGLRAGDFKAFGYETPAYVDLEYGEIRVHEPAQTVTLNVIRTGDFRQTTIVDYQTVQTAEDGASEGKDYKGAGGTLVFRPGEGFKTVTVEIIRDDEDEPHESFRFELTTSDPNAMLMRSSTLIIIEDQPVPIVPPELRIAAVAPGKILLSWEGSDACGLERSANPLSGNWEEVECSPVVDGNRCQVEQALGGTYFFYRLRLP